jgi:hypothetical protein
MGFAGGVVVEAGPAVVFRFSDEAAGDGVAVDVLALFDELFCALHVEIVVAALPELLLLGGSEFSGGLVASGSG